MTTWTSRRTGNWSDDAANGTSPWNGGTNPANGIPASGDTVTINTGHTVIFDVDQSGFAAGLASLVFAGGTLDVSTAGSYYLKMAGDITATAAGSVLSAGTAGVAFPSGQTFTIFMNGAYQINCHASHYLTLQLYCYGPPIKYAQLISATSKNIISVTLGITTTIGCTSHGYSVGNTIFLANVGGTTQLNNQYFEVATAATHSFTIRYPDSNLAVNSTGWTAWTGGGVVCPNQAEAATQTQIEIDQNVSADAEWTRTGAIVRIDDIARASYETEAYTISGAAATYLTLSSGLSNIKFSGAKAVLATRNIKINSSAALIANGMIRYGNGHILNCEIRPSNTGTDGLQDAINCTGSPVISGCANGLEGGSGHAFTTAMISGCSNAISGGTGYTLTSSLISGSNVGCNGTTTLSLVSSEISGCTNGVNSGSGNIISSSRIFGGLNGLNGGSGHSILNTTISECTRGFITGSGYSFISSRIAGCSDGINTGAGHNLLSSAIVGCNNGIYLGAGITASNMTIAANINDINALTIAKFISTEFSGTTEFVNYASTDRAVWHFAESIDHDQSAGAYKAWTRGGIVTSDVITVYPGRTKSYKHACESASYYVFQNREVTVDAGRAVIIQCYVQKDAAMVYLPRLWILLPGVEPFVSGSPDYEAIMTNSINTWETLTLGYTNSGTSPVTVTIRTLAKDAGPTNAYFDPIITILSDATDSSVLPFVFGGEWKLSQQNRIAFYLQDVTGTGVIGLGNGFTLQVSKNGGAFAASAGTKAEIGNGWYTYLATAAEADSVGVVAIRVTNAGVIPQNLEYIIEQRNPGAIQFTYTVTNVLTGIPIEGVECWFATNAGFSNIVWAGHTDAFGIARDDNGGLPLLDAGTYHIRCQKSGYTFTDDSEVVS